MLLRYKPGFCVKYSLWEPHPSHLSDVSQITLTLHSSPDLFYYLDKQLETWDGLISLTLVLPIMGRHLNESEFGVQVNSFCNINKAFIKQAKKHETFLAHNGNTSSIKNPIKILSRLVTFTN